MLKAVSRKDVRLVNLLKNFTGTLFAILFPFVGLCLKRHYLHAQHAFVTKNILSFINVCHYLSQSTAIAKDTETYCLEKMNAILYNNQIRMNK